MIKYPKNIESYMRTYYNSLNERDKRHYAAVESLKLDYGGITYISEVLNINIETVRKGIDELKKKTLTANE
jgi:hypothetical protein